MQEGAYRNYVSRLEGSYMALEDIRELVGPNIIIYGDRRGIGRGIGIPNGGRRNINEEPCGIEDKTGPGYGQGRGRGEGIGRI